METTTRRKLGRVPRGPARNITFPWDLDVLIYEAARKNGVTFREYCERALVAKMKQDPKIAGDERQRLLDAEREYLR